MQTALPQAEISTKKVQAKFAAVAPAMRFAKDIHVAACAHAVLAGSYYPNGTVVNLVTKNIRDLGVRKLAALGIEVMRADAFPLTLFERDPASVTAAFASLRGTLRSAPAPEQLLARLAADGQVLTAAAMLGAWRQGAVHC